jgi:IS1 family transposase
VANTFVKDLKERVEGVDLITTDGNPDYLEPIRKFFPQSVYGQVIKHRSGRRLKSVEKKIVTGESLEEVEDLIKEWGLGTTLNTAYIERIHLTIRHRVSRLVRKTLCFSKLPQYLSWHLAIAQVGYNFVKYHKSLKQNGKKRTPAMVAGLIEARLRWRDVLWLKINGR